MRRVDHGLHDFLVAFGRELVEKERQKNRDGEGTEQGPDTDRERIVQQLPEIRRGEEALEVPKAHPLASKDALGGFEVPESDLNAVHGVVAEDQEIGDRGNQKQVQFPVAGDAAQLPLKGTRPVPDGGGRWECAHAPISFCDFLLFLVKRVPDQTGKSIFNF